MISLLKNSPFLKHPLVRRYAALVHQDLSETYSRAIQKWLLVAPIIGIATGVVVSILAVLILDVTWSRILPFYLHNHWLIVPCVVVGFVVTGLIMQFRTPDPNEHSTEEIIRSYHEHQGDIDMRPFAWKLTAAVTTVGSGGSAALEGPGIYGGGAIGSWLWTWLRRFGLEARDRRLMLISGAAAGMAAVFRAPLTGIVFALEMPYKDDLAHEALLPALIASVVSYGTLATIVGPEPLFGFAGTVGFRPIDLAWSAGLGAACGLIAMVYTITFRRFRSLMVHLSIPHTGKMAIGGLLTGICGLIFVTAFPGNLIPIGPNYEAVRTILNRPYASGELVCFAALKLAATLFSLGVGGVSAMFVPLFLTGGAIGSAFARSVVHASTFDLYAAVGMASFIAAGYKTPLTAVVFVAETTGGHSFLIPSLIGAACAYAISGEASASGDQRLHEVVKFGIVTGVPVRAVMRREIISVEGSSTLAEFANAIGAHSHHGIFPVFDGNKVIGVLPVWSLAEVPCDRWERTRVSDVCNVSPALVRPDCDVMEALRILTREDSQQMLIVASGDGSVEGLVTKTDILRSLENGGHVLTNNAGSTFELTE